MHNNNYAIKSLELHLFFSRIMKEHVLFLKAGFTPADAECAKKAEFFIKEFDKVLCQTVTLSNCVVGNQILCSGEIVTEFTVSAERQTQELTGIYINKEITAKELRLIAGNNKCGIDADRCAKVKQINQTVLKLLDELIAFKENILNRVLKCEMFTTNYPLLLEHIIREARLYCYYITTIEHEGDLCDTSMKGNECFWNRIMMEHAKFIQGLLDPCEDDLIDTANQFSKEYYQLLEVSRNTHKKTMDDDSLSETIKFRDFNIAASQGIQLCKIRSTILPLLADHVLREANHYLRLLKC